MTSKSVKQIKPSRLEPKQDNRIEEVKKILKRDRDARTVQGWLDRLEADAREICQLFPQPLHKKELKEKILEILGYYGVNDTEGFLMSIIRKPQPLDDKELREKCISLAVAELEYPPKYTKLSSRCFVLISSPTLGEIANRIVSKILALLQPKIEQGGLRFSPGISGIAWHPK